MNDRDKTGKSNLEMSLVWHKSVGRDGWRSFEDSILLSRDV